MKFIIKICRLMCIMFVCKIFDKDDSTLCDVGCYFFGLVDKNFGLKYNFFGLVNMLMQ